MYIPDIPFTRLATAGDTMLPNAEAVVLPQDGRGDCDKASTREEVSNVMIEQGQRVELVSRSIDYRSTRSPLFWSISLPELA